MTYRIVVEDANHALIQTLDEIVSLKEVQSALRQALKSCKKIDTARYIVAVDASGNWVSRRLALYKLAPRGGMFTGDTDRE